MQQKRFRAPHTSNEYDTDILILSPHGIIQLKLSYKRPKL